MGKINVYQGVSNDCIVYEKNGSIKSICEDIFGKGFVKDDLAILNAGHMVSDDYEVKDTDILFIRQVPKAVTTVCAWVGVVTGVLSLGASIYAAVKTYQAQEEAEEEQKKQKKLSEGVVSAPFIKGASNQSALGNNIPFIMGRMYHTPYTIANGFFSTDYGMTLYGSQVKTKQYWNVALVNSFNDVLIESVSIGDDKILKGDATLNGVSYITPNQQATSFIKNDTYDSKNLAEIRTNGELTIEGLDQKIYSTAYSDALSFAYGDSSGAEVIKKLASNTYKFDLCIQMAGNRYYRDDKKSWWSRTVSFAVYVCNDTSVDSPVWTKLGDITNKDAYDETMTNTNKTIFMEKTYTLDASYCYGKTVSVKVVRTTQELESNAQETASLSFINCYQYDAKQSSATQIVECQPLDTFWRDKTNRIGLHLIANDNTAGSLSSINCMVYGCARIWNGTEWTSSKFPTRNPASWILEIMTSDIHPHSKYSDSEIDLEALGALYEYCEEQEFYCDGTITSDTKKSEILQTILTECNATMYLDYTGLWTFAIEKEQSYPVALLNEQDIKSVTVSKNFSRKPFAQKVTFTNSSNWEVDTAYFDKEGETQSYAIYDKEKTITETAVKYITTYNHAYKYAHRLMAKQELQPREISVQVGKEGDYYPLYSMVLVQMKQLKAGLSSGTITGYDSANNILTTSDLCDFSDTTKNYGIIIQVQNSTGIEHIYAKVTGEGKTKTLALSESLSSALQYGCIYSFGYLSDDGDFETITNKMQITETKSDSEGWTLTLKDYNEAIFDYGTIPEYVTNLTSPASTGTKVNENTYQEQQREIQGQLIAGLESATSGDESVTPTIKTLTATAEENGIKIVSTTDTGKVGSATALVNYYLSKDNGSTWSDVLDETTLSAFYYFDRDNDGYPEKDDFATWQIKAVPVNQFGIEGEEKIAAVSATAYGTWLLTDPIPYSRTTDRTIILSISQSARSVAKTQYGTTSYKVQIKREEVFYVNEEGETVIVCEADTQYYKPATNENPYTDETNYRTSDETQSDGYSTCEETYVQTVPLAGQSTDNIFNTPYTLKITAFNESGSESESVEISVTALCTSLRDIVKANETVKEAYITELSAITANLGEIKSGVLAGTSLNYWTLSTKNSPSVSSDYTGAFRVGGNNQYLKVTPVISGGQISDYRIDFKVGSFTVTSTTNAIENNGNLIVYDTTNPLKRLVLSGSGITAQTRESEDTEDWDTVGMFRIDGESLVISNTDDCPKPAITMPANSVVYHLDGNLLDNNGENSQNITLSDDGVFLSESAVLNNSLQIAEGELTIPANTKAMCWFNNSDTFGAGAKLYRGDEVEANLLQTFKDNMSTDWGFTETQLSTINLTWSE